MAVGITSLLDCPMLTWSLGWTGRFRADGSCPASCEQRFANTSLAFMFVLVPEPVWKMSMGKCSSSLPSISLFGGQLDEFGPRSGVEFAEFQVGAGGGRA